VLAEDDFDVFGLDDGTADVGWPPAAPPGAVLPLDDVRELGAEDAGELDDFELDDFEVDGLEEADAGAAVPPSTDADAS